jgi:CheY-like chemotaxis protein
MIAPTHVAGGAVDWSIVVLALGVLVLAFATYFTQTILRNAGGTMEASVTPEGLVFKVSAQERQLALSDMRAASAKRGVPAEDEEANGSLRGVAELRVARALWVDDNPPGNVHERRMLERLHVDFDLARSTEEALTYLIGRRYQLIVTDLTRPDETGAENPRAGLEFLRRLSCAPTVPPILVYAGRIDERRSEALAYGARTVTAIPSELLQAVVDVLRS